jgi:hypothetical protein
MQTRHVGCSSTPLFFEFVGAKQYSENLKGWQPLEDSCRQWPRIC